MNWWKWLIVAGEQLDRAADEFSNHGCNDWKWPEDWTEEEKRDFSRELLLNNYKNPPAELDKRDSERLEILVKGKYGPGDWEVMRFLAKKLIEEGEKNL